MAATKSKSPLLIAGCGYAGREVLRQCLASPDCPHHPLSGTTGSTESLKRVRQLGAEGQQLDLDSGAAPDLPDGRWSLLYMVPPARDGQRDRRLRAFLKFAARNPPVRIVYLSTSGVYGDREGAPASEDDAIAPATPRAQRRADAETQVQAFAEEHGREWVVLRVPGIYGPGRLRIHAIRNGEPVLRHEDCGPGNRVHRVDLAACCLRALVTASHNRIFNVCDDEHATSCAFTMEVARQARLPPPPQISLAEARQRFSAVRLSFLEESRYLDNARMHEALKVTLRFPRMAPGIAASLADEEAAKAISTAAAGETGD